MHDVIIFVYKQNKPPQSNYNECQTCFEVQIIAQKYVPHLVLLKDGLIICLNMPLIKKNLMGSNQSFFLVQQLVLVKANYHAKI